MKKCFIGTFAFSALLFGQLGTPVNPTSGPPPEAWTTIQAYSGGLPTYIGQAKSQQNAATTLTVSGVSKANPAVVTSTAHGLATDNIVTISGTTGDWTGLNGNKIITVIDADTFSVAVNSTAYSGTYAGTQTTTAPRTSAAVWAIRKLVYSGTDNVAVKNAAGSAAANQIWDNRASISFQ